MKSRIRRIGLREMRGHARCEVIGSGVTGGMTSRATQGVRGHGRCKGSRETSQVTQGMKGHWRRHGSRRCEGSRETSPGHGMCEGSRETSRVIDHGVTSPGHGSVITGSKVGQKSRVIGRARRGTSLT